MLRVLKMVAGLLVCATAHAQGNALPAPASGGTAIYKFVDENGRVTYANSPIKGGARVDLEPITVIPSTPSGSLVQVQPPLVARHAPLPIPVAPLPREPQAPFSASPALAVPVARVVPSGFRAPNERIAVKGAPRNSNSINDGDADDSPRPLVMRPNVQFLAPAPTLPPAPTPTWPAADVETPTQSIAKPVAIPSPAPIAAQQIPSGNAVRPLVMTASLSPEAAQKISEQRRAETRKRLLEGEMQTETQLLEHAKLALTEEQRQTQSIRALRASFTASSDAGAQPPTKEQRETIERHFERVRNLQDQVAMHETHLKGLRAQLASSN